MGFKLWACLGFCRANTIGTYCLCPQTFCPALRFADCSADLRDRRRAPCKVPAAAREVRRPSAWAFERSSSPCPGPTRCPARWCKCRIG